MARRKRNKQEESFELGDVVVRPGTSKRIDLSVARLPTHTDLDLSLRVIHGKSCGPTIWLSGGIHGDEVVGVDVIRRVLTAIDPSDVCGSLIVVPIVNIYGFVHQSRYLPDRRDLNRCFPGSRRGSLASRLAHFFVKEIVTRCTFGLDFHTGSNRRSNLPQIRTDLDDPEALRLAQAFRAPVTIHKKSKDGSLRAAASRLGIPVLLFEGGEANRLSFRVVDMAVKGTLRVLKELGMIDRGAPKAAGEFTCSRETKWVRSPQSGILTLSTREGSLVEAKSIIGVVADEFGEGAKHIRSPLSGIVIGRTLNPLVYQGDALVHIAKI